jgi:NDP-sugar pyrophosphorylase family protein
MKAFILAAGFGTRLKPWTLSHPKALVPVASIPMLERVINNLIRHGFNDITINIHHFGQQIIDFLSKQNFDAAIHISDEREMILDTGGAIAGAKEYLCATSEPILIHNVDILSNANLKAIYREHISNGADVSLLVSDRHSSRKLLFNDAMQMRGWTNINDDTIRPETLTDTTGLTPRAFSGIYCINPTTILDMEQAMSDRASTAGASSKLVFPIMDYFIANCHRHDFRGISTQGLEVLDIGKPASLANAAAFCEHKIFS